MNGVSSCLNPCFNGIWSRTRSRKAGEHRVVLILVLMEYGLGPYGALSFSSMVEVLILVLMEYGLGRKMRAFMKFMLVVVLILVLMEYGLGQPKP